MASNIANALLPLELISKLCALGYCEYSFERLNVHLSSIYVTTFWFIYCAIICYFEYHGIWISFDIIIGCIMYNCHLLITVVSIINGIYYKQIYKQCLQQVSMINDTLEGLHIPNKYKHLRKKVMRNVIRWILFSIGLNVAQAQWYSRETGRMKMYLIPFVVNHTIHVNNLVDVVYETHIWYVGSIFEKINEYILHLSTSTNCGIQKMWTTVASRRFQHRSLIDTAQHKYSLLTVMHIHLELCNTCKKLHKLFQIPLTAGMVTNLLVIIGFIYYQYTNSIKLYQTELWCITIHSIGTIAMLVLFVGKVIFLNNDIENCCNKAHDTEYMLHILSGCTYDPERQEEISQFSLQIIQKKLRLSAMGLFCFGHGFLCTSFIVVTNYAIIGIQLNIS